MTEKIILENTFEHKKKKRGFNPDLSANRPEQLSHLLTRGGCYTTYRLRAVSLFSWSVDQNARDLKMITRVTEGARRELPPSILASRGFAAQRSRACTPLTKSEEKERLFAVYASVHRVLSD